MVAQITILDAGPCITFCAAAKHALLVEVLQRGSNQLHVPDVVDGEITNRGSNRRDFPAATVPNWQWLVSHDHIGIMDSQVSAEDLNALSEAVVKLTGTPLAQRLMESRDLGEVLVIAHAMVRKGRGEDVYVVIDEYRGQKLASKFGLKIIDTPWILSSAVRRGLIADRGEMRKVYDALRQYDAGLIHIDQTRLLGKPLWAQKPTSMSDETPALSEP
ncbi:PIN domain-containing protein [Paenarthrobacter histidinolovorans]|uniref:Nucleic acid-binding protein n=1 Tax=Paenarthrobacter histidinolovorans TaxID=43664 RepID=A0ABW8MZU2_9MICC